jgi:hypothetical protein
MNSRDQLLLEQAYCSIYKSTNFQKLAENDLRTIEQLIIEGFFDDVANKVNSIWGKTKEAVSAVASKLSSKLASTLATTIFNKLEEGEKEKFLQIIASGKLPSEGKNIAKQAASSGEGQQSESFEDNKSFLAHLLFTEENLRYALEGSLLTEGKNTGELNKLAKEVAQKINALYPKNKKAMAKAIPKFAQNVSKKLGIQPQDAAQPQTNQPEQTPSAPNDKQEDKQQEGDLASAYDKAMQRWNNDKRNETDPYGTNSDSEDSASSSDKQIQPANNSSNQQEQPNKQEGEKNAPGIFQKVMAFAKAHPKLSAVAGAALAGLVVAAFAGSAPVVGPAIFAAAKVAGITAVGDVIQKAVRGKEQNWKETAKRAATGGAIAAGGSILSAGLGAIGIDLSNIIPKTVPDNQIVDSSKHGFGYKEQEYTKWLGHEVPGTRHVTSQYNPGAVDAVNAEFRAKGM